MEFHVNAITVTLKVQDGWGTSWAAIHDVGHCTSGSTLVV